MKKSGAKKGSKENPIAIGELDNLNQRNYKIVEATVKDGFCNYKFEITNGVGAGQVHSVTDKKNVVDQDLYEAFSKFNAHLAVIDRAFKHSGIEVKDIDKMHGHKLSTDYRVFSFKMKDKKGYETIQLFGEKHVDLGFETIDSPEISLDNLGGYDWYNELQEAASNALEEVALYAEGKGTPVEPKEEKPDKAQMGIFDGSETEVSEEEENELAGAKVD
jgi:hypothetical protein